uniref:C-type lectin domain-containing protein n=1 Tax=Strongyloides stercoralis TaxID=6248 RepID=A0A0K0EBF1_STRER
MKFIFITFIFLSLAQRIFSGCPSDWIYSPHDSKCYKVSNTLTGWNLGEFNCAAIGGHIASIHSPEQNQFLWELGRRVGNYIWVGAAQFGSNPSYVYSDGSPFNFEKWNIGRRPPFKRSRRCVKIDSSTGLWEQSCCKKKSVPICVKDPKLYPGWGTPSSNEMNKVPPTVGSPFSAEKKEESIDNFAAAVDGFQKVRDEAKQLKEISDTSFDFKLRDEEPINEGSDGFGKVIKLTDTMPNVDATNPILVNPDNRERVILTTIRNDKPLESEEGKDRLDSIVRSPLRNIKF